MKDQKVSELPNIGKVLSSKLNECNINTAQQLKKIGSRNAFTKILLIDNTACLDMLYALEGAVQGIRWHQLNNIDKDELKTFYKTIKG